MKILIDEMLPKFQKYHPSCEMITWDNANGIVMHLCIISLSGIKSEYTEFRQLDFNNDSVTDQLFEEAKNLVYDFIGQIADYPIS